VLTGTISAVTSFGIFVVADEPYVEGLVRVEELGDDIFSFDEATLRLVGRRSGRSFALGDSVSVEVLSVSVARRRIDLRLHGQPAGIGSGKRERAGDGRPTRDRKDRSRVRAGKSKAGGRREGARPPRGRGGAKGGRRPRG
jgi:ribonuclease R